MKPATKSLIVPAPKGLSDEMAASHYFLQGVRLSNIYNDLSSAIECYQKAIEIDSSHSAAYYEIANILRTASPEKALKFSEKANINDTSNLWYKLQLGQLCILNQKYDSALTIYNNLRSLEPNNPDNYRYLAALYEQINQPFAAISILDSAETKFGAIEELAAYKRGLLIGVGLTDKAIAETKEMITNSPYDDSNFTILGELYGRSGKDSLAMYAYNQAIALNPKNIQTIASMNEYYKRKGDNINFLATTQKLFASDELPLEAKLKFFNDVIKNKQYYQDYYFAVDELVSTLAIKHALDQRVTELYAQHMINSGNIEGALKAYKNAVSDTTKLEIFSSIIDIESYLQHPDSVIKYTDMALKIYPKNTDIFMRKGFSEFNAKRYKEAERTMYNALQYADNDSVRSVIYGAIGDMIYSYDSLNTKRYYPLYEKAIRLDKNNIAALNNYAYYLSLAEKDLEKALQMMDHVIELAPNNATYLDTQAWILYKLGRYEEAKKVMRQAVSLDNNTSKELLIHYGDILYELKEYFMASVYWKKALEKGFLKSEIDKRLEMIEGK